MLLVLTNRLWVEVTCIISSPKAVKGICGIAMFSILLMGMKNTELADMLDSPHPRFPCHCWRTTLEENHLTWIGLWCEHRIKLFPCHLSLVIFWVNLLLQHNLALTDIPHASLLSSLAFIPEVDYKMMVQSSYLIVIFEILKINPLSQQASFSSY